MKDKRAYMILIGVIICILGCYVTVSDWEEHQWEVCFLEEIQRSVESLLYPVVGFESGKGGVIREQIQRMAEEVVPVGTFFAWKEKESMAIEDEETYEILMKKQEEEEGEVLSDGRFVGVDHTEDTMTSTVKKSEISMENLKDFEYLTSHFYLVDSVTYLKEADLKAEELWKKDLRLQDGDGYKVLIFHTHSQEAFQDTNADANKSIIGVGRRLAQILNETYHIKTLHHEGIYDLVNGKLDRSEAYERAAPEIRKILKEHPEMEVVIDLHRDGVKESTHLVTEINGKKTAQIMFFNGMCRTRANGDLSAMLNPYIQDNLAFSFQMKILAEMYYPGFTRRNYIKGYKYNMDLKPKMLLIEAGAQTNTTEEIMNAMAPLADLLNRVLTTKESLR